MCSRHAPQNENYVTIHLQYSVCCNLPYTQRCLATCLNTILIFPLLLKIIGFECILHFLQAQIWLTSVYILKSVCVIGQGSI